jgi:hypothetical protein
MKSNPTPNQLNAPDAPKTIVRMREIDLDSVYPQARIDALRDDYMIPAEKEGALREALADVLAAYSISMPPPRKLAPRQRMRDFEEALGTVKAFLGDADVIARLPGGVTGERHWLEKGKLRMEPSLLDRTLLSINQLLPLVGTAIAQDGRASVAAGRTNLRANIAAKTLHDFWVRELGYGRSHQVRDGKSAPALAFILDCLHSIDPELKEASIREFESFNAVKRFAEGSDDLEEEEEDSSYNSGV